MDAQWSTLGPNHNCCIRPNCKLNYGLTHHNTPVNSPDSGIRSAVIRSAGQLIEKQQSRSSTVLQLKVMKPQQKDNMFELIVRKFVEVNRGTSL